MAKYRRDGAVVEAVCFDGYNFYKCAAFVGLGDLTGNDILHATDRPVIPNGDGTEQVGIGDWIVKGKHGNFYRCPGGVFWEIHKILVEVAS